MIHVFKKYITEVISIFMEKNYPQFLEVKIKGSAGRNSIIWEFKPNSSIRVFFQLQFIKGRDYVIPNIQWSKLDRFPSEDCINEEELDALEDNLALLDSYDEVWLSACEFGRVKNYIGLTHGKPNKQRLENILSSLSQEALIQANVTDWKHDTTFHSWDMIDSLDRTIVNECDAKYATSKLIQDVEELISKKYIPYLIRVVDRAS